MRTVEESEMPSINLVYLNWFVPYLLKWQLTIIIIKYNNNNNNNNNVFLKAKPFHIQISFKVASIYE